MGQGQVHGDNRSSRLEAAEEDEAMNLEMAEEFNHFPYLVELLILLLSFFDWLLVTNGPHRYTSRRSATQVTMIKFSLTDKCPTLFVSSVKTMECPRAQT